MGYTHYWKPNTINTAKSKEALKACRKILRYAKEEGLIEVDWIAGMFMAFHEDAFRAVRGFDERFFLYYEDVDICRRLRRAGYVVVYDPRSSVIHDARRASRRNVRLMAIHAASALRYLLRSYD